MKYAANPTTHKHRIQLNFSEIFRSLSAGMLQLGITFILCTTLWFNAHDTSVCAQFSNGYKGHSQFRSASFHCIFAKVMALLEMRSYKIFTFCYVFVDPSAVKKCNHLLSDCTRSLFP